MEEKRSKLLYKRFPEKFAELDFKKNAEMGIDVYKITYGSGKKVHWKCPDAECDHHFYEADPRNRCKGDGKKGTNCPFCNGKRVCPCKSLMSIPLLAAEFIPELNPGINPWEISYGSTILINWKCSVATCMHHIWPMSPNERTTSVNGGCPFCYGKKTCPCLSFMRIPDLARQFAPDLNRDIDPYELRVGSNVRLNWRCPDAKCNHHVWNEMINSRAHGNTECPYCVGTYTCPCDSFMNDPLLSSQFDYELNPGINPWQLRRKSHVKIRWRCHVPECQYVWKTSVSNRTRGTGCPECVKRQIESKGASRCRSYLLSRLITFHAEWRSAILRKLPYDFTFFHRGRWWIIEYDGDQHFRYVSNYHRGDPRYFRRRVEYDRLKIKVALLLGMNIIRISGDDEAHITHVLDYFLSLEHDAPFLGVDNPKKYELMFGELNSEIAIRYCPEYTTLTARYESGTTFNIFTSPNAESSDPSKIPSTVGLIDLKLSLLSLSQILGPDHTEVHSQESAPPSSLGTTPDLNRGSLPLPVETPSPKIVALGPPSDTSSIRETVLPVPSDKSSLKILRPVSSRLNVIRS